MEFKERHNYSQTYNVYLSSEELKFLVFVGESKAPFYRVINIGDEEDDLFFQLTWYKENIMFFTCLVEEFEKCKLAIEEAFKEAIENPEDDCLWLSTQ